MRRMTALVFGIASWALLLSVAGAQAEVPEGDEEARARFELAQRLYQDGEFARAAEEFERAYEAAPRAALLFNAYLAHRDAGQDARSAEVLRRFLETGEIEEERRRNLEARLAVLEREIAEAAERETRDASSERAEERPAEGGGGLGPLPWVLVGSGAAVLVASVVTGALSFDAAARLDALCPSVHACTGDWRAAQSEGEGLAIATDVLWPVGLALAGTGLVLWIVEATSSGSSEEAPQASIGCDHHGCMAVVTGSLP